MGEGDEDGYISTEENNIIEQEQGNITSHMGENQFAGQERLCRNDTLSHIRESKYAGQSTSRVNEEVEVVHSSEEENDEISNLKKRLEEQELQMR